MLGITIYEPYEDIRLYYIAQFALQLIKSDKTVLRRYKKITNSFIKMDTSFT